MHLSPDCIAAGSNVTGLAPSQEGWCFKNLSSPSFGPTFQNRQWRSSTLPRPTRLAKKLPGMKSAQLAGPASSPSMSPAGTFRRESLQIAWTIRTCATPHASGREIMTTRSLLITGKPRATSWLTIAKAKKLGGDISSIGFVKRFSASIAQNGATNSFAPVCS